ncbi:MAG: cobalamin-dependent protein, partial [bacterium]
MRIAFVGPILSQNSDIYEDIMPIGIIPLAQLARQRGHMVRKLEIWVERPHDWRHDLLDFQPDVICFSAFTQWFAWYAEVFRECKRLLPDCILVMGGPHATAVREWALDDYNELDCAD